MILSILCKSCKTNSHNCDAYGKKDLQNNKLTV